MTRRAAMRQIIANCIERGNDPDFVDALLEQKGFEVYSYGPLWRAFTDLERDGANGELYPDPSGPDAVAFLEVYESEGRAAARKWLNRRFRTEAPAEKIKGRKWGIYRAFYVPVGSLIEERLRRKPKRTERTERVRLTD